MTMPGSKTSNVLLFTILIRKGLNGTSLSLRAKSRCVMRCNIPPTPATRGRADDQCVVGSNRSSRVDGFDVELVDADDLAGLVALGLDVEGADDAHDLG